jgi:hypothetical protein
MGVARDLVGQPGDECAPPKPAAKPAAKPAPSTTVTPPTAARPRTRKPKSIITLLTMVIDLLDQAIQTKQQDLHAEGKLAWAENHLKLGLLKAADSLVRRARALLQDYGTDLDLALNPTTDPQAATGTEIEGEDDLGLFEPGDEDN